jgi:hypothetical protein
MPSKAKPKAGHASVVRRQRETRGDQTQEGGRQGRGATAAHR